MLFLPVELLNYTLFEWVFLIILLVPQSVMDIKKHSVYIVPNAVAAVLFNSFAIRGNLQDHIISIVPGLFLIMVSLMFKESLGIGDGLVMIAIGCITGFEKAFAILMSSLFLCGFVSLILIIIFKTDRKKQLPFIPFLLVGAILCGVI